MNSKRRAQLQRRLSMGAVPRPPAGLAERIKADIPKYLKAEPAQQRISTSVAFSMRLAASILLLITSALVTLHVLEPDQADKPPATARVQLEEAVMRTSEPSTVPIATHEAAAAEEVRLESSEEIPLPPRLNGARARRAIEVPPAELRDEMARAGDAVSPGASADLAARGQEVRERTDSGAALPLPPAVEAASAARVIAPAAPSPATSPRMVVSETDGTTSVVREASATGRDLDDKKQIFGISVDPETFQRIKDSLESGGKPERSAVNVEALVNYFAGTSPRPPRRGVRLEVEASPAPIEAEGDHAILRFTIETPVVVMPRGAEIPPAVKDARVEVDIDRTAVAEYRRIGEGDSISSEPVLLHNTSVTGLYELELRPRLRASQRVATVRLRYRSLTDNRERTIERVIKGHHLAKDWARASRRHRLASLGAIWGESLRDSARRMEVARRAEELATQNPGDQRARELANAASVTGGGLR